MPVHARLVVPLLLGLSQKKILTAPDQSRQTIYLVGTYLPSRWVHVGIYTLHVAWDLDPTPRYLLPVYGYLLTLCCLFACIFLGSHYSMPKWVSDAMSQAPAPRGLDLQRPVYDASKESLQQGRMEK